MQPSNQPTQHTHTALWFWDRHAGFCSVLNFTLKGGVLVRGMFVNRAFVKFFPTNCTCVKIRTNMWSKPTAKSMTVQNGSPFLIIILRCWYYMNFRPKLNIFQTKRNSTGTNLRTVNQITLYESMHQWSNIYQSSAIVCINQKLSSIVLSFDRFWYHLSSFGRGIVYHSMSSRGMMRTPCFGYVLQQHNIVANVYCIGRFNLTFTSVFSIVLAIR